VLPVVQDAVLPLTHRYAILEQQHRAGLLQEEKESWQSSRNFVNFTYQQIKAPPLFATSSKNRALVV